MSETIQKVVNPHLRVLILDEETSSIPRTLGISEEREKELDELIKDSLLNDETYTDSFVTISKKVRHANEFAYCIFHAGSHAQKGREAKGMIEVIEAMMKAKGGSEGKSEE